MKTNPHPALANTPPCASAVLAKALLNAGDQLGLSQTELAGVMGLHRTAISRLKRRPLLDPESKQGELAVMIINIHQALHALTDGNAQWMQHFMRSPNSLTGETPVYQIQKVAGLLNVQHCVEALQYPAA